MKSFSLDRDKKIYIYGAGGNCNHLINLFVSNGILPSGVIDKRASEIEQIEGVTVTTWEQFLEKNEDCNECVFVISIKNVFLHITVARQLLNSGYNQLIYKPYGALQGKEDPEWDGIDLVYESLVENRTFSDASTIPVSRINHMMSYDDTSFIEENDNGVLCYLPVEILANYDREDPFRLFPMCAFYPIVDMYRFFLDFRTEKTWDEICDNLYLYSGDWIERTGRVLTDGLKKSLIASRVSVYTQMQKRIDRDKDFFKKNSVRVRRVGAGFAIESSGRNRVSFMIARGMRFVPVQMSKPDYMDWVNNNGVGAFRDYLEKRGITELFSTIPHPLFLDFPAKTVDYEIQFCMPVIKRIMEVLHHECVINKGDHSIIDIELFNNLKRSVLVDVFLNDDGIMGRLLCVYGFNCYRSFSDKKTCELSETIDSLLGVLKESYRSQKCRNADIMIMDSVSYKAIDIAGFKGRRIYYFCSGLENDYTRTEIDESFRNKCVISRTMINGNNMICIEYTR